MFSCSALPKTKKEEKVNGQVWVKNKKVYVKEEKGLGIPPAINPCEGIKLVVNGEECKHLVVPRESDNIELIPQTILREEIVEIRVSSDEMEAYLHTKPAISIKYEIMDVEALNRIDIKALEVIENVGYILKEKVYKSLEEQGITTGIIKDNIDIACSTYEEKTILVAQGIPPVPAKDAWMEYLFSQEVFEVNLDENEKGRVDFWNFIDYKSSNVGDALAIKHPTESGLNGKTVTGKEVVPTPPKDITLCGGNGVIIEDEGRLARCILSGKAVKQQTASTVCININEKLEINTDVDIKIGNVKFKGNVVVNRNVKEGMEVAAKEDIYINGDCHFATVRSGNNVAIKGNVISSTIQSGDRSIIIRDPADDIKPIVESIVTIISEIENSCKGTPISAAYPEGISSKVEEILNYRCQKLPQDIYSFIIALKSNQYDCLIEKADQLIFMLKVFLGNCKSIKTIDQLYMIKASLSGLAYYAQDKKVVEGNILLTYAANSEINAKGSVKISDKGCFNCSIHAYDKITIAGIVRGSEIHSERMVEINQVGSEMGVPTVISVPIGGTIKITKIFNDNVIKIGPYTYRFIEPETNVYARVVDGKLVLR